MTAAPHGSFPPPKQRKASPHYDEIQDLIEALSHYSKDPLGFVYFAFPWGVKNTALEKFKDPEQWQLDILTLLGAGLITVQGAIRMAVASGHGIGKSALVAWIILWAVSTFEDTRGVVTANTETQLRTKTWSELTKWHQLFIGRALFELTATSIYSRQADHSKTWRVDMVPWSERNTEAFAGLHNQGKRLLLVFDEASAIPDIIHETSEGALTDLDTEIIWLMFGNPTRNTGRFREAFGKFAQRWLKRQIDSRTVKITNKLQIAEWEKDYGPDSDFFRVRVRGVFPRAGDMQFIASDLVEAARRREPDVSLYDPLIMGVDVARFGDDKTVFRFRKGRDARTHKAMKFRGLDTMQVAARVAEQWEILHPDAIFVDAGGPGAGVCDRLRYLRIPIIAVDFGGSPDRSDPAIPFQQWGNKRIEMYASLRAWLPHGAIDDDQELVDDLTGVQYGFMQNDGRDVQILEAKKDMKKRGLQSPDDGDALALTFAYPVAPSASAGRAGIPAAQRGVQHDYDPFSQGN